MQTRSYKDLFRLISSMIGTGGELAAGEQIQVADFINRRFQQAFDESPVWPRYLVVGEPRTIVPGQRIEISEDSFYVYGAGTSAANGLYQRNLSINSLPAYTKYDTDGITALFSICSNVANDEVFIVSGGTSISNPYFYSATLGSNNEYDNLDWSIEENGLGPAPSVISTSNIGDFQRIYKQEPFLNNSAIEYEFFVTSKGANILNLRGSENESDTKRRGIAFVSYKKQFTPFTVTSDFYNQGAVEVPSEFFNYIAHAVYADFLRVQNKQQEAIAEEQIAQTYLNLELEKIDIRSNNNTINKRFSTYVNQQSR